MANIPEPEAKHILTGEEPLIILEYPEELPMYRADVIKGELKRQGVERCLILNGGAHIDILDPKPGQILLVKVPQLLATEGQILLTERVKELLERRGVSLPVLVAEKDVDVSLIDEATMRRLGWVRAPKETTTTEAEATAP